MSRSHHHFIIPHIDLTEESVSVSAREVVHQLRDVLKLELGEEIVLGDGDGNEATVKLVDISPAAAVFQVRSRAENREVARRKVVLYCAVLKRDSFEWVVEKATEAGAAEIVPLITERTVKLGFNRERLEKIAREASEQSHRGILPVIHDPVSFEKVLEAHTLKSVFFFDFTKEQFVPTEAKSLKETALFVGPEGGWSGRERELAEKKGFLVRSLGPTVLRAETAAIIVTYMAAQL